MTAYLETKYVAHVMQHEGGGVWMSHCQNRVTVNANEYEPGHRRDGQKWPVKHVMSIWGGSGTPPTKPWCRHCVVLLARQVAELIGSVLLPSGLTLEGIRHAS